MTLLIGLLLWGSATSFADHAADFLQKQQALKAGDVEARLKLVKWCQSRSMPIQASDLCWQILEIDPDHEQAYQQLVHLTDTNRLPKEAQIQNDLKKEFGPGFKLHVAPHFLVIYNTDENWARNRAALLEKTHDIFYKTFRRLNYRPLPLRKRLICVLFNDYKSYLTYAKRTERQHMAWAGGYYSSRTNRTAFYHDRENPAYQSVTTKIAELETQAQALQLQLKQAAKSRKHSLVYEHRKKLNKARQEQRWYKNRLKAVAALANSSKTVHEASHQLSFNSSLQTRGNLYPFWVSEGLATNFETNDPSKSFGPMTDNPGRRKIFYDAIQADKLIPLDEFITMYQFETTDREQISVIYSQAWALFHYLIRFEATKPMRQYLQAIAKVPPGMRTPDQMKQEFIDAFGPLDKIEKHWQSYIKRATNPLVKTKVFEK